MFLFVVLLSLQLHLAGRLASTSRRQALTVSHFLHFLPHLTYLNRRRFDDDSDEV
jgi:hypothetical protein